MRLCIVSSKGIWPGENGQWYSWGGFPAQAAGLASLFDGVTILTIQEPPREGQGPLPAHARIVPLRKPHPRRGLVRKLAVVRNLGYYVKRLVQVMRDHDVIYLSPPGDIPFLGLVVGLLMRKRMIVRYCTSWEDNTETTLMNRMTKGLMRRFAGGRSVMLATGLIEGRPAPKMEYVFSTTITQEELDTIRPDYDRPPGNPFQITYVGRLTTAKGVALLLRAADRLRSEPGVAPGSFQVNLVGDGPERGAFEEFVQARGLQDTVRFYGMLEREPLLERMLSSDIGVLASYSESFGKVLVEAMMCGVPVVTTAVGSARQIVGEEGERGWIVPVGDEEMLTERLCELLTVPRDWPALRRRCRDFVEQMTLEAWAARIGEIAERQWGEPLASGK